jgi:VWFA-related protein
MYRYRLQSLLLIIIAAIASVSIHAQEVEETIRIKTRVVFLDALVKDKKTNLPISNLSQENFEVLDDGKPRPISYFTREGQARKPLALIMVLDLREDGAARFLKQAEILKSMENELEKLPPGDEVAIVAMNIGEDEGAVWLTEFTNERLKIAAALERVQAIAQNTNAPLPEKNVAQKPEESSTEQVNDKEVVHTQTIQGRNGAVVTRTTIRDGSVHVKRVSKDGKVTVDMGSIYDLSAAVNEATRKAQTLRPNSQLSLVWVSDGIAPIFFEDRDATEEILIRDNVIFNSLTVELRTLFKFLLPIGKPIAGWVGLSLYGSAKHLAQRSGGEAVKVGRVKDYGAGLSRIIGNLTARYSLGFTLAENETDDGRLHQLEVRVKAQDEKGKKRKLQVSSRQGYYMAYPPITQKQ